MDPEGGLVGILLLGAVCGLLTPASVQPEPRESSQTATLWSGEQTTADCVLTLSQEGLTMWRHDPVCIL